MTPVELLESEVYPNLDPASLFPDLNWNSTSSGWSLDCPVCKAKRRAFLYRESGWIYCNRRNDCGSRVSLVALAAGRTSGQVSGSEWRQGAERLAASVGVALPSRELTEEEQKVYRRRDLLEVAWGIFRAEYQEQGEPVRKWLVETRDFPEESLEKLPLGFYWKAEKLRQDLEKLRFTPEEVRDSGLIRKDFEGRMILPWQDQVGRPLSFKGRDLTGTAEGPKKSLNLRGTMPLLPIFLPQALASGGREELRVVEGEIDALHLQARGMKNVVALPGSNVRDGFLEELSRLRVEKVVFLFDQDKAGEGAGRKLCELASQEGTPRTFLLPPRFVLGGENDPDDYLRKAEDKATALGSLEEGFRTSRRSVVDFRLEEILGEVSLSSPDAIREEKAREAVAYLSTLRGPYAPMDRAKGLDYLAAYLGMDQAAIAETEGNLRREKVAREREHSFKGLLRDASRRDARGERPESVLQDLRENLDRITSRTFDAPPPFSVEALIQETRDLPEGRSSGWSCLDRMEVAFNPGELSLAAAITGHGKTSFMVSILLNWIRQEEEERGEVFLFYSAEEPDTRIFHRLLAALTGIENPREGWGTNQVRDYFRGREPEGGWYGRPHHLKEARELLQSLEGRLQVIHRPMWNVDELAAHARQVSRARPVAGVLVDYLQRIPPPPTEHDRRDIAVSATARRLKALAEEVSAPVLAGVQVNRDPLKGKKPEAQPEGGLEDREVLEWLDNFFPDLHHLREGGSEQEADLVLGLFNYKAEYLKDGTEPRHRSTPFGVRTLKNRYGEKGATKRLEFYGESSLLLDREGD